MAIKVSGTTVVDNDRNFNVGVVTATSLDVPPTPITFDPAIGASGVSNGGTPQITFNTTVQKGSGNITLRDGSASGSVIQTIAVSSSDVTISGGVVTINPGDMPAGKNIYFVVDAGAFESTGLGHGNKIIDTWNFTRGAVTVSSFNPTDNATDVAVDTNIVITFSHNIAKGSGNITIRSGSASGTALQTIDVTSGAVSVSGTQATINPPSDLAYETVQYIVVDAGCFTNTDGDAASGNAIINGYNITTEAELSLGDAHEGGYLICCSGGNLWIVAPYSTQVTRTWHNRNDAVTTANSNAACGDWFVPTCAQLKNPGATCATHWDTVETYFYWSNTQYDSPAAYRTYIASPGGGTTYDQSKNASERVRAFRCVSY